ncbi:MAG: hypothetical protein WCD16_12110, partial [Paracoccaceae bacterium]
RRNEDRTAGALWLPPEVHPDEERLVSCFEKTVALDQHEALFSMFGQIGAIQTDRAPPLELCADNAQMPEPLRPRRADGGNMGTPASFLVWVFAARKTVSNMALITTGRSRLRR